MAVEPWLRGPIAGVHPLIAPILYTFRQAREDLARFTEELTDEQIRAAQDQLWQALRVVAEPGGAAAFAALLSGRYRPQVGERVGVLVCGGNTVAVDFSR